MNVRKRITEVQTHPFYLTRQAFFQVDYQMSVKRIADFLFEQNHINLEERGWLYNLANGVYSHRDAADLTNELLEEIKERV